MWCSEYRFSLDGGEHFWSLVVLVLGITQNRLLVDGAHSIIQVLHLLVGIAGIGLAERLAAKIKRKATLG